MRNLNPKQAALLLALVAPVLVAGCGGGALTGGRGSGGASAAVTSASGGALANGVAVTASGAKGSQTTYTLAVPAGATNLVFTTAGGSGDEDMYVRFGSAPTLSTYDCRPYVPGNAETCTISNVQAGTYYVMLNGWKAYSGVSLKGSYTAPSGGGGGTALTNGVAVTASGAQGSQTVYTLAVPAGATGLVFATSGGSGDEDLYVRFGAAPTLSTYDCRPYVSGNAETCTISNVQAGTYYVMLNGYQSYSGVSLTGSYTAPTGGGGGGTPGDFTLTLSTASVTVAAGASATVTLHTAPVSGTAPTIAFHATGLPTGVTATFSPTQVTAGADTTVTLAADAAAAAVSGASVRLYGASSANTHYQALTVAVTASSGGGGNGGGNALTNGVAVSVSGAQGSQTTYTLAVPAGATNLVFTTAGGSGDEDMYVRFGSAPTLSTYDCRPYVAGNAETCTISNVQAGTYYVMLNGYQSFANVSLTGSYTAPSGGGGGGTPGDFTVSLSTASATVAAGASTTVTVHTATVSGTAPTIAFHATGLPTGVTATFSPTQVTAGADTTVTLAADASAAAVSGASVRLYGASSAHTHYATLALDVSAGGGGGGGGGGIVHVLFDDAHAEQAANADWIVDTHMPTPSPASPTTGTDWKGAYSSFGVALVKTGKYDIQTLPPGGTLSYGTSAAQDLSNYQVLVIPEPNDVFTSSEMQAIDSFVQNGGGLIAISDHGGADRNHSGYSAWQVLNQLFGTASWGVHLTGDNVSGTASAAGNGAVDNGPYGPVHTLGCWNGSTMTLDTTANASLVSLSTLSGGTFDAQGSLGQGRFVVHGDSSTADDGTASDSSKVYDGWTVDDDAVFFENAVAWVAQQY